MFRFREFEYIDEFLRHILSDDEISILRAIACFPLYRRLLDHETHNTTVSHDWMNKRQIAAMRVIPLKKIYGSSIMNGLVEAGLILERIGPPWGSHKKQFKINTEIPMIRLYVRPFQECFEFTEQSHTLSQFLKDRGVSDDMVDDLLRCLKPEPVENWNALVVVAVESAGGSSTGFDWLPWYLKNRDECRQWLTKVLEALKLPTEAINSIIIGLRLNYESAQKEMRNILSKKGVSGVVIDWLIKKLNGFDEK